MIYRPIHNMNPEQVKYSYRQIIKGFLCIFFKFLINYYRFETRFHEEDKS